jgi:hypothetical protein
MADAAPIDRLPDILELVERIERQTGKLTRETFLQGAGVRPLPTRRLQVCSRGVASSSNG